MSLSYVHAISFVAPGLPDWLHTRDVLRGERSYEPADISVYQPNLLPPNERRRASPAVRMAFRIAEELTQNATHRADELASVFSSSDGDLAIAHRICNALADTSRLVSPTDFHNSVHNSAAGYWSIAANAKGPSTAISAFDHSFAVGLLEAHAMVQVEQLPTLLVVYDIPAPKPLHDRRPLAIAAGVGLLLSTQATNAIASISIKMQSGITSTCDRELEALRNSNPAARALPLLQAIAKQTSALIHIDTDNEHGLNIDLRTMRGVTT